MKSFDLKGEARKEISKKNTSELRSEGKVPCVLYGGKENVHFSIDRILLDKVVFTSEVYVINLDVDGKTYKCVIQQMQFHPVTDKVIHVDFVEAVEGKPVVVELPVKFKGISVGVDKGGKLNKSKRYLKVKGEVSNIPENIEVDITELNIGDNIKVKDIKTEKFEILESESALVVSVITSRAAIKTSGEEDGEEAKEEAPAEEEK